MKSIGAGLSVLCFVALAATAIESTSYSKSSILHNHCTLALVASTPPSSQISSETVAAAKANLLDVARKINYDSSGGVFISDPEGRDELKKAVLGLEAVCGPPLEEWKTRMIGDWTLLCTTNTPRGNFVDSWDVQSKKRSRKRSKSLLPDPFGLVQWQENLDDRIRKSFDVTQRIRFNDASNTVFDRVDNVVEFSPFGTLGDLVEDVPDALSGVSLNPLDVTKSKAVLIHKAEVQSVSPVLRTRIGLTSIVLNVGGKSQFLEPEGADVLGLNVPLGEFLNAGNFDTTFVDEDIRVSRGTTGFLDELRVFVRKIDPSSDVVDEAEEVEDAMEVEEMLPVVEDEENEKKDASA